MVKSFLFQREEWPDPEHGVSTSVDGGPGEEVCLLRFVTTLCPGWFYRLSVNLLRCGIYRCEESTSSPAVSNSIGEGIIEEEEEEEVEAETNKKRMKEDDQEVLSLLLLLQYDFVWESWKNH